MTKPELKEFVKNYVLEICKKAFNVIDDLPERKDGVDWGEINMIILINKITNFNNPSTEDLIKMLLLSDREYYPGQHNDKPVYLTQEEINFNKKVEK